MICSSCGQSTPNGSATCRSCATPVGPAADATRLSSGPAGVFDDPDAATGAGIELSGTSTGGQTPTDNEAALALVGQPLGSRYRIQKLLGAGGMGAVYEAWDRELGVVVALKTVRPEIAADPEMARLLERRFKQELLLARQVTHKNIVRVHDMGEVDGIKYITMPYLEGEDLGTVLKREGRLPVARVMRIARQVASGLAAAHEAGVVHRDLKPANIMITPDGDALIMDFGVATSGARSVSPAGPDGKVMVSTPRGQTMMGSVVGTIEYMAPEQARAQAVDQRADIYAFGLILYDLLLGRTRASRTDSVVAELNLRMSAPPPPPRSIDPAVPESIERIIMRAVQTDTAARYATTEALIADLDKLDEEGKALPITRRLTWRMTTAALIVFAGFLGLTWWLARGPAAPVQHEAVSVVIADIENTTGDQAFDGTLEPMLKLALEDAAFISAYDRLGIRRSLGVRPPEQLDERAALELAVKQGVGVVLSGRVERQGSRYAVSVKATQAVTGNVLSEATERVSSKDRVLAAAATLASGVRDALGDDTSGSARRFAMETISATSLEAVREYAQGMEALSRSRFEDALRRFETAVQLDPGFGSAYGAMAIVSRNLDRQTDAEKYVKEALRHLDGMTPRERLRTQGMFYYLTSDYQSCVKEYGDLVAKFSADASARNNRALCLTALRELPQAVEEMQQVIKILPNRALYRENLALYSAYSGDFAAAETEVRAMTDPGWLAQLALAFAQVGQSQLDLAAATYTALGKSDDQGASYTVSGLADLAAYQGRFSEAARRLTRGAADDLKANETDRAARKFAALAYVELQRQQKAAAVAAAERALTHSQTAATRFLAARVLAEAGAEARATVIAAELAASLQAEPQSYARIIEGLLALQAKNPRQAIQSLTEANRLLDTWISHFDLGRAYVDAGMFIQAGSEFDRCLTRRGEVLALFLDEEPTHAFLAPVHYYKGLAMEGRNSERFVDSYRTYLDIRGTSSEDPLLPDVRRRAGR